MKRGKFLVEVLFAVRCSLLAVRRVPLAVRHSLFAAYGPLFVILGLLYMLHGETVFPAKLADNGSYISSARRSLLSTTAFITEGKGGPLLHTLPRTARYFTVDKLQQVYLVDEDNAVYKYSPAGKELFYYNNNTRGKLGYIDVTDPFNLLLFYPGLQTVATLDRTLNETGVLPLFSAGIVNATAIGLAVDNNVWVYDQANFQLKKVGQDGQVLSASDNLSAQLIQAPQATQLTVQNNMLYLNCPGQGIFVFDNFGQFHQLLPYETAEEIQLLGNRLVLYEAGQVRVYNPRTLKEHTLHNTPPADSVLQVRYQGDRYYQLTAAGKVKVYSRRQ